VECPACKEPMIILELDQIEIDYCYTCGGIWLDAGELELLLEDSPVRDELLESFEIVAESKEKSRKCPQCRKRMEKVRVGKAGEVLIDQCRNKHGIWFDKGELEAVISSCGEEENSRILSLLKNIFANQ